MQPVVIYGKNGQVGTALKAILGDGAIVFASSDYDFSELGNIQNALNGISPKAVINAAAYTDVNKAESEEEAALKGNALVPEALAKYCKARDIPFITYSTDYVFPGNSNVPQKEGDATAPLNAYGRSKLVGEQKVAAVGGKYIILRTSWVYDHSHKNFFVTMMKLGAERESLSIVGDQLGAPTYAPHLAAATVEILNKVYNAVQFPSGIYHLCNSGFTSWHGFASAIFEELRGAGFALKVQDVKVISSDEFPTPARRPLNSRLDCSLALKTFGVKMPDWGDGLKECVAAL